MPVPAELLAGLTLDGAWKVLCLVNRPPTCTGGHFSHGYIVESPSGEKGYLKALDYSSAFLSPDPAMVLQALTEGFNHERALCMQCKRLSRVVNVLAEGKVLVDPNYPASVVQYLIFELADGDVRSHLDALARFDIAWCLRSLHHVATGLFQLHRLGIAHQDLKPSNVLAFPDRVFKIADLGRASSKSAGGPHEGYKVAGDMGYAPPDLLYGYADADWGRRRLGCDVYLLGSMVVFFFTRTSITALILDKMDPTHHWQKWQGTFDEVLPYVRHAFGRALEDFGKTVPSDIREELVLAVRQLCEPDPRLRGHPGASWDTTIRFRWKGTFPSSTYWPRKPSMA